ncbi:MAG: hypothetical protein IJM65_05655 [Bacteroidales bacterium]|nr:hypothetical protein [Bacteroidales bacterium]
MISSKANITHRHTLCTQTSKISRYCAAQASILKRASSARQPVAFACRKLRRSVSLLT